MKLNHLNLTVTDVAAARAFLETYLGMHSAGGNDGMAFLTDAGGFLLSLMKARHGEEVRYPANVHIGFGQPSDEHVNAIHRRLVDDGYDVPAPSRHHAWTFYVAAPGGITVEVFS